jgi:hypothetical protein
MSARGRTKFVLRITRSTQLVAMAIAAPTAAFVVFAQSREALGDSSYVNTSFFEHCLSTLPICVCIYFICHLVTFINKIVYKSGEP